jgi:hypothetical protein
MNQESEYWALFNSFAKEMQEMEKNFPENLNPKMLKA